MDILERNQVACKETDGCIRQDNRVAGTYLHGFFDDPEPCRKWLEMIGINTEGFIHQPPMSVKKETGYALLRAHFDRHVDLKPLGIN